MDGISSLTHTHLAPKSLLIATRVAADQSVNRMTASLFLRVYCPTMILTMMSMSSLLLPAVDWSTRLGIPLSTISLLPFMYEAGAGLTNFWLLAHLLFNLAILFEYVFVGPKHKYKSITGDGGNAGKIVDHYQLEQIRLSVSRSQLDRRSFFFLTLVYSIFLAAWFGFLS